jgi:uncharacterized Zn finger protein (UPF0148 family)
MKRLEKYLKEATTDMMGKKCEKCGKGAYKETSIHDDRSGTLHCSKCGAGTKRHKEVGKKNEEWRDDMENQKSVAIKKYPELMKLANKIAKDVATEINREAPKVKSEMPYKQQFVLEEVINILRGWV